VDELCEIFSVSDVQQIVHKHLRIQDSTDAAKDPIIHFYEDFLQEYDPSERKKMGAYYTPIPVVKYIIRHVDKILKEDFGIAQGLASSEAVDYYVETGQDLRFDRRSKTKTGYTTKLPRVQVLDPAVGTATFLNEAIKFIHEQFSGQEGRWPAYVKDNLIKRLYGFELMMAPYTIAHLKLGMTLKETGVNDISNRLGVYLTNTLEEGVPIQQDIFSFGLAEAVSEESRYAADIKSNHPIMVVMGNPPYSVSSSNKSLWIQNLIKAYKKDLNERKINLDDDYIKFIRFAEEMISKNGSGVVAMITNNSYLDGITHRQMRKHLMQTFDKVYVLDLHGSTMKKEAASDGSKDENVFDIMQGVSIVLMVKTGAEQGLTFGDVYHAELLGTRKSKFASLNQGDFEFSRLAPLKPSYFFVPKDLSQSNEYEKHIGIDDLFIKSNSGIKTDRDKLFIDFNKDALRVRMEKLLTENFDDSFKAEYRVENSSSYKLTEIIHHVQFSDKYIKLEEYRPFDYRYIYYDPSVISRPGRVVMAHQRDNNPMLLCTRQLSTFDYQHALISTDLTDICTLSSQTKETGYAFPLYLYHEDGERSQNFRQEKIVELFDLCRERLADQGMVSDRVLPKPEEIFDYIYATLYSPSYRNKYKELLKTAFPRIPKPESFEAFHRLAGLGRELRELHLMKSASIGVYDTTFPVSGDGTVEKVAYDDKRVWINNTQYFGNVPESAWNFYIGGYQPAQKWLKDRKGRTLTNAELDHYQRIIKVLLETDRLMRAIG
jgi:predicted helicase